MFPGSVAGLPESMATMPQLMREAGYRAHMVGKWHLGHAQWKQGPVGRREIEDFFRQAFYRVFHLF